MTDDDGGTGLGLTPPTLPAQRQGIRDPRSGRGHSLSPPPPAARDGDPPIVLRETHFPRQLTQRDHRCHVTWKDLERKTRWDWQHLQRQIYSDQQFDAAFSTGA